MISVHWSWFLFAALIIAWTVCAAIIRREDSLGLMLLVWFLIGLIGLAIFGGIFWW